ncbi:C6 transcription factor (Ctf1B) [Pochonia chlamydosporia 170]|uniref:C6 transcription factor (Ctf1B) n=1 Tax=Pochonia chlamydosporia 170 TaxID=1380566 RepID=A0A179F5F1_METCM|nr:C6 transcription factor (Ctf1B) [Pochonia chlamydosporia 170]OAQ60655.2 C6 transcription factor (Ctf1B) [Pochonia chlamydosporia 170]
MPFNGDTLQAAKQRGSGCVEAPRSTSSDTIGRTSLTAEIPERRLTNCSSGSSMTREHTTAESNYANDIPGVAIPPYVKPFPKTMSKDDIDYLVRKQVLNLPSVKFRNICLQGYVEWVHFFCPLLDLGAFLNSISCPSDQRDDGVSLMLLYAVLLTGVAFIDERYILDAGYESRLAVRKEFFTKAKILYSFGCELDRKVIVQSLLLMSYFQEKHDEPTNHWYWAELGCVMARTIGLFLDPTASNLPGRTKRLWKRIGWSCILRDRVLNLGVRMPPKVRQEEFRVPNLVEEDFEPMRFTEEVTSLLPDCELLQDEQMQRHLARMCIEKTKLCILLGDVFNCLYKEGSPKLGETSEITLILQPKSGDLNASDVAEIGNNLQTWLKNLPSDVQSLQPLDPIIRKKERIAFAHSSMLHMFYQTILCAFYRPQILAAPSPTARDTTTQRMSYSTMMITRHFEDLQSYGLIQYLPSSAVTFLLTAAVNHLVEYKTVDEEDSQERHLRRFRDCLGYLKTLQTVHVYAKYGGIFLISSARQEGITVPTEPPDPEPTQTSNVPFNPTDREGLGPWAVAHTPDVLMHAPNTDPATKKNKRSLRSESNSISADGFSFPDIRSDADQISSNNQLLDDTTYHRIEDMNYHGWIPGVAQSGAELPDADTVSNSSGFLNCTLWEHGWIDQIAENWLEQLPSGQDSLGLNYTVMSNMELP